MTTPGRPTKQRVNISISPEVLALADHLARKAGETRSAYLTRLIREDVAQANWRELMDKRSLCARGTP